MLRVIRSLWNFGLLGTGCRVCAYLEGKMGCPADCRCPVSWTRRWLKRVERYLDGKFDRKFGTDTSGIVPLCEMGTLKSENIDEGHWYEATSVPQFKQIMDALKLRFDQSTFVDFGSGKGRVLLLASEYGFRRLIGVEFAPELHDVAGKNVAIWERRTGKASRIELVCMDAVRFPIPDGPLVLFFFSPFKGSVMKRVLDNVLRSLASDPRDAVLIFFGSNPESIKLLEDTGFACEELNLRVDRSRFKQHRGLIFRTRAREK